MNDNSEKALLIKDTAKSARVKSVSLHPTRPWALLSHYSGLVQIYDYRLRVSVEKYGGVHEGPVRACAFHPTQPLFATGGDDKTVRLFDYHQKKLLFTFTGHGDYVRQVSFHHESPWLMSVSDDQTIRIWNWQSRQEVSVLTGHSHYVMCAHFHPSEDLVASASLDQSVRIWDISGLKKRKQQQVGGAHREIDLFAGANEPTIRHIIPHPQGVNWVIWSKDGKSLVTGSDDAHIKIFSIKRDSYLQVSSLYGHTAPITGLTIFSKHPHILLSTAEDRTIRIWDMNKNSMVFKHSGSKDRFWCIDSSDSLMAAGHDSGMILFKLQHERVPQFLHLNTLFFLAGRQRITARNLQATKEELVMDLKTPLPTPCLLYLLPGESRRFMISFWDSFMIVQPNTEPLKAKGITAVPLSRGRIICLEPDGSALTVYSAADCSVLQRIPIPVIEGKMTRLLPASPGQIILATEKEVCLYEVSSHSQTKINAAGVKRVVWSSDFMHCALISSRELFLVGSGFRLLRSIKTRVKSAVWETPLKATTSEPILYYNAEGSLRYALLSYPDQGIVKSLDASVLYFVHVQGDHLTALDRQSCVHEVQFETAEPWFKRALRTGDEATLEKLIGSGKLIGQAMVQYLQDVGHARLALRFCSDPEDKFELALQSGELLIALDAATSVSSPVAWERLAEEALRQGQFSLAITSFRQARLWNRLATLLFASGDMQGLRQLVLDLTESGDNLEIATQAVLMLGDAELLARLMHAAGRPCLSIALLKGIGKSEAARELARACSLDFDVLVPNVDLTLRPHTECTPSTESWPRTSALVPETPSERLSTAPFPDEENTGWVVDDLVIAEDLVAAIESPNIAQLPETSVHPLIDAWKASPVPVRHVMAMDEDGARRMLTVQAGVTEFEPLEPLFKIIVEAAYYKHESPEDGSVKLTPSPAPPIYSLVTLQEALLSAHDLMTRGRFFEAQSSYRRVLHMALLSEVGESDQQKSVLELMARCRQYILAAALEQAKRLPNSDSLRLALLATQLFLLLPEHRCLVLRSAVNACFKQKLFSRAGALAAELLDLTDDESLRAQMRKLIVVCERSPDECDSPVRDGPFSSLTYNPINELLSCTVCSAEYDKSEELGVCVVCELRDLKCSAKTTGLRLYQ